MKCFQAEVMNESVYMRIKHSREQAGRKRQNTGMIKGVIFDMDGTMFDTERLSSYCWKRTGENLGINVTDELMNDCRGKNPAVIRRLYMEAFGETFNYDAARVAKHVIFNEIIAGDGVPVKKGLEELLGYLEKQEIKKAVATSTEKKRASKLLQDAGVYEKMDAFVYGDEIKESKPDPEIFRVAAEKIGCKPEECLVLEDSEAGLRAGIALGGAIIYIPDIAIVPEQVTAKVTETLADLGEVIGWLEAHRCNAK